MRLRILHSVFFKLFKTLVCFVSVCIVLNLPVFFKLSHGLAALRPGVLYAEDTKKTKTSDTDEDEDYTFDPSKIVVNEKPKPKFSLKGKIEYEHFINTFPEQSFLDAQQKLEARAQFKIKYGLPQFYVFSVTNVYMQPSFIDESLSDQHRYSDDLTLYRNLSFSSQSFEAAFQELYLCYMSEIVRIRLGNQIFSWGTADTNNPTSYFNPSDMRELLYRGSDESKIGIPALSFMFFFNRMNLEIVFAPIHVASLNPAPGNFWSVSIDDVPMNIEYITGEPLPVDFFNFAYGARFAATVKGYDFSFSYYHGPDKNGIAVPYNTDIRAGEPLVLQINPQYYMYNAFGFDFSTAIDRFTIQFELAYSFDKPALISQSADELTLPMGVKQTHYLSYSAGFNYKVPLKKLIKKHQGESLLTVEWSHSVYLDDSVEMPAIPAMIVVRYDDHFYENHLIVSFTAMFDVFKGGFVLWPKVGWDFQNSFKIELSYSFMYGVKYSQYTGQDPGDIVGGYNTDDTVFLYMKDKDLIMMRLQYVF